MGAMCNACLELHLDYVHALQIIPGDHPPIELHHVNRVVRCQLETHTAGAHYGIGRDLPMYTPAEVWVRWYGGHQPTALGAWPDCHGLLGDEPCILFDGHPGPHSWHIHDPVYEEAMRRYP